MVNRIVYNVLASVAVGMTWGVSGIPAYAVHQTDSFSPVVVDGHLPYRIGLVPFDFGNQSLPTLHSFAKAQWDGKWLLVSGRTNGLHGFTFNGFENFPPALQNRDVWVMDPVSKRSWHRSLEDVRSGLSAAAVDAIAATNNQFYQDGQRLYVTGGYGVTTDDEFVTFDVLTSIDVPGLTDWVQSGDGFASDYVRQIHDPLFTVTGGTMHKVEDRTHLVFGQNFQGEYTRFGDGDYTRQVRSFEIVDDGVNLGIKDVSASPPQDAFRRRDLNVLPVIRPGIDGIEQGLVALSGVFTPAGGAWTVPVEIAADGTATMADPMLPDTFKQAMNTYHSAKLGMYSDTSHEMHMVLMGGISLHEYDRSIQTLNRDDMLPFINQLTSVVIDPNGNYTQHLLDEEFPEIYEQSSGKRLRFGTNAEFMIADGIPTFDNGVIRMDALSETTTLGYVFGGIVANQGNNGDTAGSGAIFEVVYAPLPDTPGDFNRNGVLDLPDVNELIQSIAAGTNDIAFDLNVDDVVDSADLDLWVKSLKTTWIGDANLDGQFNSGDLVSVFQAGLFEQDREAGWDEGDWTGDLRFNSSDFVAAFQDGGYEMGLRAEANVVPEPRVISLIGLGIVVLAGHCRRAIGGCKAQ